MKIFLICSKHFYGHIPPIQEVLESAGHVITLPNSYSKPEAEEEYREQGEKEHAQWKAEKIRESEKKIQTLDAVLVLNFGKNGIENYIGGATFIEMYDAFRLGKKVFLINPIPEGILKDEILGFMPTILNGDLSKVQ